MKAEVVLLSEIEEFIQYSQLERELQVRLTKVNEAQQEVLKELEVAKNIATKLQDIKAKHRFKSSEEVAKLIRKYAR